MTWAVTQTMYRPLPHRRDRGWEAVDAMRFSTDPENHEAALFTVSKMLEEAGWADLVPVQSFLDLETGRVFTGPVIGQRPLRHGDWLVLYKGVPSVHRDVRFRSVWDTRWRDDL
jgi:hypothetical protein